MENIAEALKMAAFVLIFVMALTLSINSFGEARKASQAILDMQDREYDYTYVKNNGTTERIINAETIVPSIYKAYKENYKIVFQFKSSDLKQNGLYRKAEMNSPTGTRAVYSIDLEKDVVGNDKQKENFIKSLLYDPTGSYAQELKKSGIFLNNYKFYDRIIGRTFTEKLGVYYQEELQGKSDTPEANKTKKRVITYIEN